MTIAVTCGLNDPPGLMVYGETPAFLATRPPVVKSCKSAKCFLGAIVGSWDVRVAMELAFSVKLSV
jgi:hypothetical protein